MLALAMLFTLGYNPAAYQQRISIRNEE